MHRPGSLLAQGPDRVGIGIEVALRVRVGAGALAQHVEGAQGESGLAVAARQRRINRLADNERMPQQLHRLTQRRAHEGGDHRLGEAGGGKFPGQFRGHLR